LLKVSGRREDIPHRYKMYCLSMNFNNELNNLTGKISTKEVIEILNLSDNLSGRSAMKVLSSYANYCDNESLIY
jgi:hypothetical protein